MNDFDQLMDDIKKEAEAEGPEAVAQLAAFKRRFALGLPMTYHQCHSWARGLVPNGTAPGGDTHLEVKLCRCNSPHGHGGLHMGNLPNGQILAWDTSGEVTFGMLLQVAQPEEVAANP